MVDLKNLCNIIFSRLSFIKCNWNTFYLLIIIIIDTVSNSLSSTYWFRLNKSALEYSYLYSQIFFPIPFFIAIWPIYYMFEFGKTMCNREEEKNPLKPLLQQKKLVTKC